VTSPSPARAAVTKALLPSARTHLVRALFWSGTITFGLVSVPIDLYPAVHTRRAPMRMLGPEGRLPQRRYYCSADDEAFTKYEIVRGYE
jgi:non-homologous end joining protein Ku